MNISWSNQVIHDYAVVTGCDSQHEWMLEWWYNHYRTYNDYPVYIGNFGMSESAIKYAQSIGRVINLRFKSRRNWFKKPFAILGCEAKRILWTDSDCEIRGNLQQIFDDCVDGKVGVTLDPYSKIGNDALATGIICVEHGHKYIVKWAEGCYNAKVRGDQDVFNALYKSDRSGICILKPEYQWLRLSGHDNSEAVIMHWTGIKGKNIIRSKLNMPVKRNSYKKSTRINRDIGLYKHDKSNKPNKSNKSNKSSNLKSLLDKRNMPAIKLNRNHHS